MRFKSIDLFAGIGGIRLGFDQAFGDEIETVFVSEWDEFAQKTYKANFRDSFEIAGDITKIDKTAIPDFDILAAGFPCQPFSVCGKGKGFADPRGNLFFEIGQTIDAKRPSVVFLENVANLIEHDGGRTFDIIHKELAGRDYYLRYLVADACEYADVPQHRTRTYLLAFSDKEKCERFRFPEKRPLTKQIRDILDFTKKADDSFYLHPDDYGYDRMKEAIKDDRQIYRFSDYGVQSGKDGISFTLKANMGTYPNRVPVIKDKFGIRRITPMECLALQGFPPSFTFPTTVPLREQYKQAGNAVINAKNISEVRFMETVCCYLSS